MAGWKHSAKVVEGLVAAGTLAETIGALFTAHCAIKGETDPAAERAWLVEQCEGELASWGRAIPRAIRNVDGLLFNTVYGLVAGATSTTYQISTETLEWGGFLSHHIVSTPRDGAQALADAIVARGLAAKAAA